MISIFLSEICQKMFAYGLLADSWMKIKTFVKSISEVPREVLTSTDNNDDEVLETSRTTNPAQSALSGFLINMIGLVIRTLISFHK